MSLWLWILLAIICFSAASILVGLFVAAILAKIGREACALIDFEPPTALLSGEAVEEHAVSAGSSVSSLR